MKLAHRPAFALITKSVLAKNGQGLSANLHADKHSRYYLAQNKAILD